MNAKHLTAAQKEQVEYIAALLNVREPVPKRALLLLALNLIPDTFLEVADDEVAFSLFRRFLRQIADEWISCAREVYPHGRLPMYGLGASEKTLMRPSNGERYLPQPLPRVPAEFQRSLNSWLWKVCRDYLTRIKPAYYFHHGGRIHVEIRAPFKEELDQFPPKVWPPFLEPNTSHVIQWQTALFCFIRFLNVTNPALLDQCCYCGAFFVRNRVARRYRDYKRSPSCIACAARGARDRKRDQRSKARKPMMAVAAKAWLVWKKTHRTPDRYAAVAARVTAQCADECQITVGRRWVTKKWARENEGEITRFIRMNSKESEKI
jgi:hypothetical protein